jgi:hypothetical protein|tara:strand:- start:743 stop:934 length:192 start_codon:yes stop_codon:yes gene_type:complete
MKKNLTRDETKNEIVNRWMKLGRCFDEAEMLAEEELEIGWDTNSDEYYAELEIKMEEYKNASF